MLLFLISLLFVLSNGVPLQLQPLKNFNATNLIAKLPDAYPAKNLIAELLDAAPAQNLIAELLDAGPAKVQEIITLVELLMKQSWFVYQFYIMAADVAQDHDAHAFSLQTAVTDAVAAKNNAEGAKTGAQSSLDAEKNHLDTEVASLQQVVNILTGLSPISGYDWTGCYVDKGARDFEKGPNFPGYTIQTCFEECSSAYFQFSTHFALQNNGYCSCSNHAPAYAKVGDGECGGPCVGETTTLSVDVQRCGGRLRNAVYSKSLYGSQ